MTRRILVVDDERDAADMLTMCLEQLGHEVISTTDALGAVELARETRPDLILLDIGKALGQESVRIVALTGRGEREDHARSRVAGFDAHLPKPVDMALLKSILAQIR
jgi:CheY-like chemotaxis protein